MIIWPKYTGKTEARVDDDSPTARAACQAQTGRQGVHGVKDAKTGGNIFIRICDYNSL